MHKTGDGSAASTDTALASYLAKQADTNASLP